MGNLENDELFISELKNGYKYQKEVNDYFLSLGYKTDFDELKIRKNRNEINDFTDDGDLTIKLKKRDILVEIKSRKIDFMCIQDFPYDTIFVDRVNTWKRKCDKGTKPHAIIVISQITKEMIVIPVSTENKWLIETKHDWTRNYDREYYMCDKKYLKSIHEFKSWLNIYN